MSIPARTSGKPRPAMTAGRGRAGTDWHRVANAVVLVYLAATVILLPLHAAGIIQRWTVVHVLLLGAVTNAIVTWTVHFTTAMLHAPSPGPVLTVLRLIGLNLGVLGILTGIGHGFPAVTLVAGTVFAAAIVIHLVALSRMTKRGLGGRFTAAVRFYRAAPYALFAGMTAGVVMGIGAGGPWYEHIYAAHLSLNLLGWVGLTVLGTLFLLWPTVLGARMADGAMRAARRALPLCVAGLTLAAVGMLAASGPVAAAGLVLYLVGAVVSLVPAFQAKWRRVFERPAALMLAAAVVWLLVGLGVEAVAAFTAPDPAELSDRISGMLPWFLAGFVVQILVGSLTHLLPIVLGRMRPGGSPATRLVNWLGRTRTVAANLGVALVALPLPGAADVLGWTLVTVSLGGFVVLATAVYATRKRDPMAPAGGIGRPRRGPHALELGLFSRSRAPSTRHLL